LERRDAEAEGIRGGGVRRGEERESREEMEEKYEGKRGLKIAFWNGGVGNKNREFWETLERETLRDVGFNGNMNKREKRGKLKKSCRKDTGGRCREQEGRARGMIAEVKKELAEQGEEEEIKEK